MRSKNSLAFLAAVAALMSVAACSDTKTKTVLGPDPARVYTQIERLGNPLTSEVFFMKRDHGLHNTQPPSEDKAGGKVDVPAKVTAFVSSFGRPATISNTLSAVLVPDIIQVYPNRAASTASWLSWALQPGVGYGGRKLPDDVVDAGLMAVFGNLLDPSAPVLAGLTSDNVPPSVRSFSTTFPYLENPR